MANRKSAKSHAGSPSKKPSTRKSAAKGKSPAAAPLLASSPKKVGRVTGNAEPKAAYQPKTAPPPLDTAPVDAAPSTLPPPATRPQIAANPLAIAEPWLRLGLHMTMATIAVQARMARAALEQPPGATALRQAATTFDAWREFFGSPRPEPEAKN